LVIGKSKKPRCFKNVKSLPVDYEANKTAWMTSAIFVNYIKKCDEKFHGQGRKVLFFMDQCPCHPKEIEGLKAIKIVFFPANCTSRLQPLDLGNILHFKIEWK
jgi:hypothetical protein